MVSNERPDDEMLVRYLVGTTTDEETEALDELSIVDESFAERLRAAEHDLVDAYASSTHCNPGSSKVAPTSSSRRLVSPSTPPRRVVPRLRYFCRLPTNTFLRGTCA